MLTNKSSIFLLLSFGLFLTVSFTCFISLVGSGWRYSPYVKTQTVMVSDRLSSKQVLGMAISKRGLSLLPDVVTDIKVVNRANSVENREDYKAGDEYIIETNELSRVNIVQSQAVKNIKIILGEELNCQGLQISFDEKKTWLIYENNSWFSLAEEYVNRSMSFDKLEELSVTDYYKRNSFYPGITESINFRFHCIGEFDDFLTINTTLERYQ